MSENTRAHRTPPRPRGLRRVGSYDSLQQNINSTFSNDHIKRLKVIVSIRPQPINLHIYESIYFYKWKQ